jgi:protein gp37
MKNSKIEWCDHTFNPWIGCTKVSPGCANCYAETRDQRFAKGIHWGKGAPRQRTSAANWKQPLAWNKTAICKCGGTELIGSDDCRHCGENFAAANRRRPRVFCASLADWLDEEVELGWIADLLDLIRRTPNLDWLLLTKRPQNWRKILQFIETLAGGSNRPELGAFVSAWLAGNAPANVWIGTTVEDQLRAAERIPALLSIPAKVRFISCEPLLGQVDLTINRGKPNQYNCLKPYKPDYYSGSVQPIIHWVIVGGESGSSARGFCTEYAWDLVLQCKKAGVPVFVKQLGVRPYTTNANAMEWPEHVTFEAAGSGAAAALIGLNNRKGGDFDEFPEELQVREFPSSVS